MPARSRWTSDGNVVGKGDIVAQTRQVMENLRLALEAAGATFADVVKITNYVVDANEWKRVLPVRAEYIKEPYPASTFVEVSALMFADLLIEIEAVAVVYDRRLTSRWPPTIPSSSPSPRPGR